MNSVWQQITLTKIPIQQWREVSYVDRIVGALRGWRKQSWIMQRGDAIAAVLISLVLMLAPFAPTGLIGLLMGCSIAFWGLLTLCDDPAEPRSGFTPIHLLVVLY